MNALKSYRTGPLPEGCRGTDHESPELDSRADMVLCTFEQALARARRRAEERGTRQRLVAWLSCIVETWSYYVIEDI